MANFTYFESTDEIFQKFDNYEIWPCTIVGKDSSDNFVFETCDFYNLNIVIWCVYGHFYIGGLECVSDHGTLEEAEGFKKTLPVPKRQL